MKKTIISVALVGTLTAFIGAIIAILKYSDFCEKELVNDNAEVK